MGLRNDGFEDGIAWDSPVDMDDGETNVVVKGGFSRPIGMRDVEVNRYDSANPIPVSFDVHDPIRLRDGIIAKAAAEARSAYNHWMEAVSFLRIVEPGAEREYGTLTKSLHDAAAYMEGKE